MKLGLSLGMLASLQLAASLLLQIAVLTLLGAGSDTDAWVAAQAVPLVAFSILAVSLQGAWQSRLAVTASSHADWMDTQRKAQGQLLIVFGGVNLLLIASSSTWVPLAFPGLSARQAAQASDMARLLLLGGLLNGQANLLTTALRARENFILPEAVTLAGSVGAILMALVALPRFGIEAAAWASLIRSCVVFMVLFRMAGYPMPSLRAAWADSEAWSQMRPILLGSAFYKTGPLVDRYWSSLASAGGMTLFNLIQTGCGAVASVLERALCMPVAPSLARMAANGDFVGMRRRYRVVIAKVSVAAVVLLAVLLAVFPIWPELVGPLLKLNAESSHQAWLLCVLLIGYLHPAASGSVVVASFYALGDTRTPVRVGVCGFTLSLLLKALGFLYLGLPGLALATVAHYLGNMLVMCWLLERRFTQRLLAEK